MLEHEAEKFTSFFTTLKFLFVDCRFIEVSSTSAANIVFVIYESCSTGSISTEYWNMRQKTPDIGTKQTTSKAT